MSEPIITLDRGADVITMTGTNVAGGWIYDNDTLDAWLKLANVQAKFNKRPNAHGTYSPDQLFGEEHRTPIVGQYYGTNPDDAEAARSRLSAMFNDGRPILVTVETSLGATSRVGFVLDVDPEWMPDAHFRFELLFAAPDPRRYADAVSTSTGLPSPSSGLVWPLGSSGAFWNWGTPGNTGRVSFDNIGNTTTYPVFEVSGGDMPSGFSIVEVETGRELTFPRENNGATVRIDARTQRITINGSDVTGDASRKEWPEVPAGETRTYQFTSLGATTGIPTMALIAAAAYL